MTTEPRPSSTSTRSSRRSAVSILASLAIDGADGTPIASTSLARPDGDAVTREIQAGALAGGRSRVWGAASARRLWGGRGRIARGRARGGARGRPGDRGPTRRGRSADRGGVHGRQPQRSSCRLPPDAGLRHRCPLRGRTRGRGFLRPVQAAPTGSPAERGGIADVTGKGIAAALLMAFVRPLLHAAIDHRPARRGARAHEQDPGRGAALVAVHHRARWTARPPDRPPAPRRTRVTNRR